MKAFSGILSEADIDNVTAYIRSLADEGAPMQTALRALPTPEEYVIDPGAPDPDFTLQDGRYVSAADLHAAMVKGGRLVRAR